MTNIKIIEIEKQFILILLRAAQLGEKDGALITDQITDLMNRINLILARVGREASEQMLDDLIEFSEFHNTERCLLHDRIKELRSSLASRKVGCGCSCGWCDKEGHGEHCMTCAGGWQCGKCDQEKSGSKGEVIPEHFRTCPKRNAATSEDISLASKEEKTKCIAESMQNPVNLRKSQHEFIECFGNHGNFCKTHGEHCTPEDNGK